MFADLGIENMCSKCPFAKKAENNDKIEIHSKVINDLWNKKEAQDII